jgi:ketosteroid isomerase-like protein
MVIIQQAGRKSRCKENGMNDSRGIDVLESLIAATNRRDLDGLVDQFAADVRSDTPAHPARSFVGREQVRRNWQQILGAIGDLAATIAASATGPGPTPGSETVWAEIAFDGHRPDGVPFRMRGVTVNEVVDGRIAALRFYLEPVDDAPVDADTAVRRAVAVPAATPVADRPEADSVGATR